VIKGDDAVGTYADEQEAHAEGYRRFGFVPFLVKRVERIEPVYRVGAGAR
jgi:hypothetical protein